MSLPPPNEPTFASQTSSCPHREPQSLEHKAPLLQTHRRKISPTRHLYSYKAIPAGFELQSLPALPVPYGAPFPATARRHVRFVRSIVRACVRPADGRDDQLDGKRSAPGIGTQVRLNPQLKVPSPGAGAGAGAGKRVPLLGATRSLARHPSCPTQNPLALGLRSAAQRIAAASWPLDSRPEVAQHGPD